MGWKASCLLASNREDGYLGTIPEHDPQRAAELARRIGSRSFRYVGAATFEEGFYSPNGNELYVGAYDGAAIVGTERVFTECLTKTVSPLVKTLDAWLPGGRILAMALQSVTGFFGYAFYDNGKLLRLLAGSPDDGVIIDMGEPLPEEFPKTEEVMVREGKRYYLSELEGEVCETPVECMGEEFVFELSRRFFDRRLDESDDRWNLKMDKFIRSPKWGFWSWLRPSRQ
jgi:hypothetical protein